MKNETLIFDLDGTLVEARELHHASFEWAIQQQIPEFILTDELKHVLEGIPSLNKVEILKNDYNLKLDTIKVFDDKQDHTNLNSHLLSWNANLPAKINSLSKVANVAVASNARSQFVYNTLFLMGITQLDIVVSANFIPLHHRKPSPYMFIEVMRLLDADPATTTIFEDSPVGIEAAHKSGAHSIIEVQNSNDTYNALVEKW